jgi:hypothetical protein
LNDKSGGKAAVISAVGRREADMEVVIRIVLLFFFVQFVVVMTIMSVALLMARPEVPVWGVKPGRSTIKRVGAFVLHLPSRALRAAIRLAQSMHLRSVH